MRRVVLAVLAGGMLGAAALAPGAADPSVPDEVATYRQVTSTVLACPEMSVTRDSAAVVAGLVAGAGAAADVGSASLRALDTGTVLAPIETPGEQSAVTVSGRTEPPVLLSAQAGWAPYAAAGLAARALIGPAAGLASVQCVAPGTDWWFVGAGSQLGRGAALLVSNPSQEPARFDISLFARSGAVPALSGTGIDLGPRSHVRLRLDALAPDQDLLALHVSATSGRVAAALRDVTVPDAELPQGVDFIPAAQPPAPLLRLVGIPDGDGSRDLVVVNPGDQFATIALRLATEDGTAALAGLDTVTVPASSVVSLDLVPALAGRSGTLLLQSDVPVTAAVRSAFGDRTRETAWLSATPPVRGENLMAAAGAVAAGAGLTTTVTVAAPDGLVSGTLSVLTTGQARNSVFATDGGPLANSESGLPALQRSTAPAVRQPLVVPAGTQRSVTLGGLEGASVAGLVWTSAQGSAPAYISHLTRGGTLATGYQWWPTTSAVRAVGVQEDTAVLAPTG